MFIFLILQPRIVLVVGKASIILEPLAQRGSSFCMSGMQFAVLHCYPSGQRLASMGRRLGVGPQESENVFRPVILRNTLLSKAGQCSFYINTTTELTSKKCKEYTQKFNPPRFCIWSSD